MIAKPHTDIAFGHWTQRLLPPGLRPYARLARWDRPIGIWLLLFPGWWSLALAWEGARADLAHLAVLFALFGIGTIAMRGAGCTWNDMLDREFDAQVERTRNRPIPAGEVTLRQAVLFMILQSLVGLIVLLTFNWFAVGLGAASLLVVAIYPLMKRITDWPQFVLGLAFNWGALLGWAAWRGELAWPAVTLYGAGIAWTLVYDTIYAMQDQRDDAIIGVRSTARRFQRAPHLWIGGFSLLCLGLLVATGMLAQVTWPYWIGLGAVAAFFAWQLVTLKPASAPDCLAKFRANRMVGWLLLIGILAARAL
ncbi:MAG: 4-hydroxybenzoate octaprenyltransferase [Rhodospirillales bacterium]